MTSDAVKLRFDIRPAVAHDIDGLTEIYNDVIQSSTSVYASEPVSVSNRMAWFQQRNSAGFPVLVADSNDRVIGFATFGEWRTSGRGYQFTVEHSVHVHREARGRGCGRSLMLALIQQAQQMGKHVMIGGVDADNSASLRFHERLGFYKVAHFRQVGFKFNRWLDLVFMQKDLAAV